MEEATLQQPQLIGRESELIELTGLLKRARSGEGSTVFISGEAGIGKTRLVNEFMTGFENKGVQVIRSWCLPENLEPLMPIRTGLREAGLYHLISGKPPPKVISVYLLNQAGLLIAKSEREETDLDPDIFTAMLKAVENFIKDSFGIMGNVDVQEKGGLDSIGYGGYTIVLQSSGFLTLGIVIEGGESEFLIADMQGILRDIGGRFDSWSGNVSETASVIPKIARFIESRKYDGSFLVDDPRLIQENLFDNVLLGLRRISNEKPVILFLDDLQWIDATTCNLLHYLSRNTRKNSVMIMGTYRPEEIIRQAGAKPHDLDSMMKVMNREGLLDLITLGRLSGAETTDFIKNVFGTAEFKNEFYDKIFKETGGTPLFILEILRLLNQDGSLRKDENGFWKLVTEIDELDIPSKVYDVVQRRLDRLDREGRELLEFASIVGEEFSTDIIGSVLDVQKIKLLKQLNSVEKTHRLIRYSNGLFRFDHTKVREVLYSGISGALREEYHRMIADALKEIDPEPSERTIIEVAYHYFKAGDTEAGKWLVSAGDLAKNRFANKEALTHYGRALDFIKEDVLIGTLEKMGDVQRLIADYGNAVKSYERVLRISDDRTIKSRMLRKLANTYVIMSRFEEAARIVEKAKELLNGERTPEFARTIVWEGYGHLIKGEYDKALPIFRDALDVLKSCRCEPVDLGNVLRALGNVISAQGQFDEAIGTFRESLEVMEAIDDNSGIAAALNNIGLAYFEKGHLRKAHEHLFESQKISDNIGDKLGNAMSLSNIGSVYYQLGEFDNSLIFHQMALEMREMIEDKTGIALTVNFMAQVFIQKGEFDKARELIMRGFDLSNEMDYQLGKSITLDTLGKLEFVSGNYEDALTAFEKCAVLSKSGDQRILAENMLGLAETHLQLENYDDALGDIVKAMELATDFGLMIEMAKSHRLLGAYRRKSGKLTESEIELNAAREIAGEIAALVELAIIDFELALLDRERGHWEDAQVKIKDSVDKFRNLDMIIWAEKAEKIIEEPIPTDFK